MEKPKPSSSESTNSESKFTCIECLEKCLKENTSTKSATLCRSDSYTVSRHKERRHKPPNCSRCHVLPFNSKEVKDLRKKYLSPLNDSAEKLVGIKKSKRNFEDSSNTSSSSTTETVKESIDMESTPSTIPPMKKRKEDGKNSNPVEPQTSSKKVQSTLFSMIEKKPEEELTLKDVMAKLEKLELEVTKASKHHVDICNVAFADSETSRMLEAMRASENILNMADACKYLEWFYDEETKDGLMRCKACFFVQETAKPSLRTLGPYQAQKVLSKDSRHGTFATGLLQTPEKSTEMITGKNSYWSRQKFAILEHFTMIGKGSAIHKKALEEYKIHTTNKQREYNTIKNVFRGAVGVLKLKAAAMNFETMLSLLSTCGVPIGNIGHSRKNFNDIINCLEKAIDEKTSEWLRTPLPSTGMPPHFWSTVDKATPSRETNQAVIIVARDKNGDVCPIPVSAPTVYEKLGEAASYYHLAKQMTDAIKNNFSSEVLTRYTFYYMILIHFKTLTTPS